MPERLCISVHVQLLLMCELTVEIGRVSMSILFFKKKKKRYWCARAPVLVPEVTIRSDGIEASGCHHALLFFQFKRSPSPKS